MATQIKKTVLNWKEFQDKSSKFENGTFHKTNEGEGNPITDEDFNKLVIKLIDHERDEIKRDGPEKGITADELEMMHNYISHNGWYEKYTVKAEKVQQDMNEAWKGAGKVNSTGQYSDKTVKELRGMAKELKDKKSRTATESTKLRQINFAIRSKTGWGKVNKK